MAPDKEPRETRNLGILAAVFSLPYSPVVVKDSSGDGSHRPPICGDFGVAAHKWIDLLESWNARDWLMLPVGPGRVDRWLSVVRSLSYTRPSPESDCVIREILDIPGLWFDKCPYVPCSAFALNPTFICEAQLASAFPPSTQLSYLTQQQPSSPNRLWADMVYSWIHKQRVLGQTFQDHVGHMQLDSEFIWSFTEALQGRYACLKGADQESSCGKHPLWVPGFLAFVQQEGTPWLTQYCFFETFTDLVAVQELMRMNFQKSPGSGVDWAQWPQAFRQGDVASLIHLWNNPEECAVSTVVDGVPLSFDLVGSVIFQAFTQYVATRQLLDLKTYAAERNVCLMGDVPIYLPVQSADCWSFPEVFCIAQSENNKPHSYGGTPPDYWSATGQLWGTPTYDWANPETEAWWEKRLLANKRRFHKMRIDHFRAFADAWSIPYEWAATKGTGEGGTWKRGPGFSYFARLIAEYPEVFVPDHIIVEDLGEETEALVEMRTSMSFPRMVVFQFDIDDLANHVCLCNRDSRYSAHGCNEVTEESTPPAECGVCSSTWIGGEPPFNFVAFTGTHDNPSLAEWWSDTASETTRRWLETKVGRVAMRSERMPRFLLQWLLRVMKPHSTLIVPVQDLLCLGKESRINYPGQYDSNMWSWQISPAQMARLSNASFSNWVRSIH